MENQNGKDMDKYIKDRYDNAIGYYWSVSKSNKRWYKITRSLTVIVGALVTLIASLASSKVFEQSPTITVIFTLGTPVLAAILTIISGFSQSFQWGSTWQNMVLTAQYLQKEFDRFLVTPENERNYSEEAVKLNDFVITETEDFFSKMLGGSKPGNKKSEHDNNEDDK